MELRSVSVVLLVVVLTSCSTVYVITGREAKISTEREVSQTIGRQRTEQPKDRDDKP